MVPEIPGLDRFVEVGRGGFGTVYRAHDRAHGRDVAVKVVATDEGVDPMVSSRFERECRALGALSGHPNIVAIHQSGHTATGDVYCVMEYLPGGTIAHRVRESGPVPVAEVLVWGTALAGALETAHRAGILHRDVKPANVILSAYGLAKLADFGIARVHGPTGETHRGTVAATLLHSPPEVIAGSPGSVASDVYSLASTLYTALAGTPPFYAPHETNPGALIVRVNQQPPPPLARHGVPDPVAEVIEWALAKEPADRPLSAFAFGEALARAATTLGMPRPAIPVAESAAIAEAARLERGDATTVSHGAPVGTGGATHPPSSATPEPRRRPRWHVPLAALLGLGVGVGATAAWAATRPRSAPQTKPPAPSSAPQFALPAQTTQAEGADVTLVLTAATQSGAKVTSYGASGLPPGLQLKGNVVQGHLGHETARRTTSLERIETQDFDVTLTATSETGRSTTRKLRWRVRDTQLAMPSYIGLTPQTPPSPSEPAAGKAFRIRVACAYDPQGDGTKIYRQSIHPGDLARWGQQVNIFLGKNDPSCARIPKGSP